MKTTATYRRLLRYAKPYRVVLVLGIIAGFLAGASNIGILANAPELFSVFEAPSGQGEAAAKESKPSFLKKLNWAPKIAKWFNIKQVDPKTTKVTFGLALLFGAVVLFFFAFRAVTTIINRFCMRWVGVHIIKDLRNQLFNHLQRQSLKFYGKSNIGHLLSRINNDVGAVERAISTTVADLTRAPMEILGIIVFVTLFTVEKDLYVLPLTLFIGVPLIIIPIMFFSRRVKGHIKRSLERISDLNSRMHEVFTGIRIVKAFNMGKEEERQFAKVNRTFMKQLIRALKAELSISAILEIFNATVACLVIIFCFAKGVTMAELIAMAMASVMAYSPLRRLAKVNIQIQRSMAAASRIFATLDITTEIREAPHARALESFTDEIVFDQVDFAYEQDQRVLHSINLTIPKGKVVAVAGRAGCGKTTLANLLGRFYDPEGGAVKIDGVDLRELKITSLRALIGVVTQDTILFNDTFSNNIAYGDTELDFERVVAAAKRANAHDFIMDREAGYDTVVGDKGFMLSGGQKQRIAIARALYKDPQILILDEATSALDSVTEQLVQAALNELMKDRTVFAIAHRLSTIRRAYRIYVLNEGRVVEEGTHEELMAGNGSYREMYELQTLD